MSGTHAESLRFPGNFVIFPPRVGRFRESRVNRVSRVGAVPFVGKEGRWLSRSGGAVSSQTKPSHWNRGCRGSYGGAGESHIALESSLPRCILQGRCRGRVSSSCEEWITRVMRSSMPRDTHTRTPAKPKA